MDPTQHNYYAKLMKLYQEGRLPAASLSEVEILHDDWCAVYTGGYCNCDPDIQLRVHPSDISVCGPSLQEEEPSCQDSSLEEILPPRAALTNLSSLRREGFHHLAEARRSELSSN